MSNTANESLNSFEKLIQVATTTKESLFKCWKDNGGAFVDKDKMTTSGLMAEASGLTSLLLFLVAFSGEEKILTDEDCKLIREIHKNSFSKIYSSIEKDGFTADPLMSIEETCDLFDKSKALGYVDTIAWVLSISVLTRFLDRYHILTLDIDILQNNNKLLAKSLNALITSQRDDGTWGFLSNKKADRSLYFTFVANAALADFFDYIMGEISLVTDEMHTKTSTLKVEKDEEMIAYLKKELQNDNIEQDIENVRIKIQDWLIYDCLPLLPEVAQCKKINRSEDDERKREEKIASQLGLISEAGLGEYGNYFNLYYIYYLIEMMVTSGSDNRAKELFGKNGENVEGIKAVKNHYRSHQLMDSVDAKYYMNSENISGFWKNIMEQSIHTSRTEYMKVSRTGKAFWDSKNGDESSLKIYWPYSQKDIIADDLKLLKADIPKKFTDPCIIPMALRSNTMYCYYISEQPDMTVDRLFDNICSQVAVEDTDKLFSGLWDNIQFSLIVTERSVEAIVDYYDYLVKFDKSASKKSTDTVFEKSKLDIAIETKISEFINSESGTEIIRNSLSALEETAEKDKASVEFSDETFKEKFEQYIHTKEGIATVKKALGSEFDEFNDRIEKLERQKGINNETIISTLDKLIDILSSEDLNENKVHIALANRLIEISKKIRSLEIKKDIEKSLANSNNGKSVEEVYALLSEHIDGLFKYMLENYSTLDIGIAPDLAQLMKKLYDNFM